MSASVNGRTLRVMQLLNYKFLIKERIIARKDDLMYLLFETGLQEWES